MAAERPPAFVSLGMVVVDELRSPGRPPLTDIPGGSGTFSTFGARLVAGEEQAAQVGCFVLAGHDFPVSVRDCLDTWGITLTVQVDAGRQSTRGLLEYHDAAFSRKTFRYTTPPLQPTPTDLPPLLQQVAAFHLLAGPAVLTRQVAALQAIRPLSSTLLPPPPPPPLLVWEPLPIEVSAAARDSHLAACRLVDVFSPNHLELMTLFQGPVSAADAADDAFSAHVLEQYATAVLAAGVGPAGAGTVVVRAGSRGCLVASRQHPPRWLPAFVFAPGSGRSVVDATGAGNTFLGGLTFGMAQGLDAYEAAKPATVAASFVLEQIGLATRAPVDGGEQWNGQTFAERYGEYITRLADRQ